MSRNETVGKRNRRGEWGGGGGGGGEGEQQLVHIRKYPLYSKCSKYCRKSRCLATNQVDMTKIGMSRSLAGTGSRLHHS